MNSYFLAVKGECLSPTIGRKANRFVCKCPRFSMYRETQFFQFLIVLHHLHHVTTDTLQYIRTIIIPNKRTLHNDKKRKMCAVTKVA